MGAVKAWMGAVVGLSLAGNIAGAQAADSIEPQAPAGHEVAPVIITSSEEVPCQPTLTRAVVRRPARRHHRVAVRHPVVRRAPVIHKAAHVRRRVHHPVAAAPIKAAQKCYVYHNERLTQAALPLERETLGGLDEPDLYMPTMPTLASSRIRPVTIAYHPVETYNGGGFGTGFLPPTVAAAPEPSTWSLMIIGVGLAGLALRRRRPKLLPQA